MFDVKCMSFIVPLFLFVVQCLLFHIPCSTFHVPCSMFHVPHSMFHIPCSTFHVQCMLFPCSCLLFVVSPIVGGDVAISTCNPPCEQWLAGLEQVLGCLLLSILHAPHLHPMSSCSQ